MSILFFKGLKNSSYFLFFVLLDIFIIINILNGFKESSSTPTIIKQKATVVSQSRVTSLAVKENKPTFVANIKKPVVNIKVNGVKQMLQVINKDNLTTSNMQIQLDQETAVTLELHVTPSVIDSSKTFGIGPKLSISPYSGVGIGIVARYQKMHIYFTKYISKDIEVGFGYELLNF